MQVLESSIALISQNVDSASVKERLGILCRAILAMISEEEATTVTGCSRVGYKSFYGKLFSLFSFDY